MSDNSDLHDIKFWQKSLGLFPVPLFSDKEQRDQFVLLNGNRGNFCLDINNENLDAETRNRAWSSNVGHYVSLIESEQQVGVQRWDAGKSSIRYFSYQNIHDDLEKFHNYLERHEPKSDLSVVSHVIRVFRSLRNVLGPSVGGPESLKAFLYLLACVRDQVRRDELGLGEWRLDTTAADLAKGISTTRWKTLEDELVNAGRLLEDLRLDLTLLLRHASGRVFQEAHYEAVFVRQGQLEFEGMLPQPVELEKKSKGLGLQFTPQALARTLVEEAFIAIGNSLSPSSIIIFDPAAGSGEFLREALRQLKLKAYKGKIKLVGWDISQAACDMANFVLAWEGRGYENQVDIQIRCVDSTTIKTWPKNVDIVLMNPPFVSWQGLESDQKERVKVILGDLSQQRPDLSSAFVWKASFCLRKGGVIGSILPASFLDAESTEKIRGELSERVTTKLIARLGSHLLFESVLIDAALYLGHRNGDTSEPAIAFWADHRAASNSAGLRELRKLRYAPQESKRDIIIRIRSGNGYSIYDNPDLGRSEASWAPRPYSSWQLLNRLQYQLPKVKDLFDVKQGVRTGLNPVFILNKEQWEKLPKTERHYFRPAVVNKSIRYGFLRDTSYLFFPYGKTSVETETELRNKLKTYYEEFLLPNKDVLFNRGSRRQAKWWELSEHRTWQETPTPKIVSTYFGDIGSFAWDGKGDYVVVQGFGWVLKPTNDYTELPAKLGLAYLAILNSQLFSDLLSATSNHVSGGQWNLSKKFVGEIPLPDLLTNEINPTFINDLSKIGRSIYEGKEYDSQKQTDLVEAIYRVNEFQ